MRSKRYLFIRWLSGFAEIIDGIFMVFTFGFWTPNLTMSVLCFASEIEAKIWEKRNII